VTQILPWAVDLAVVGGVGMFVLFDLLNTSTGVGRLKPLAGLAALALAAIRRWAALPAFGLLVVGIVGLAALAQAISASSGQPPPLAPAIALSALATPIVRRGPVPVAVVAAGAGAIAVAALSTWPGEAVVKVVIGVLVGGAYALGVGVGVYLRHLDDEQVRAADAARRSERLDIARELHDLVAHYVTGIVVQAQAAQVMADRDPAAAGAALERIEGAGRDALTAMRGMVGSLRGASGDAAPTTPPVGLAALDDLAGLEELAVRSRATGLPVTVRVSAEAARVARGATAASTHRIVQESLTNVHRHAVEPTHAEVDVRLVEGRLVVTVSDDGRPAVTTDSGSSLAGGGFGLVGMAERAHALDGHLAAGPVDPPALGWRVQAVLPVDPA
jgi:signal transduction histidine kinase